MSGLRPHRLERPRQHAAAAEIVVVDAEALDAVAARQHRLAGQRVGVAQVVVAEIGRQMRLVMAGVARPRLHHVGPFGEAGAPPQVVLRRRVELRQVEGQHAHRVHAAPAARPSARTSFCWLRAMVRSLRADGLPRLVETLRWCTTTAPLHVAHPMPGGDQAQAEIGVLAIGRTIGFVEQRVADQRRGGPSARRPSSRRRRGRRQ